MIRRGKFYNGVLLLNKPVGITSHDAVLEVRKAIRQRRVGHTGTLDPRAEGLMVICLGRATKIAQFVSDFSKVYEAEVYLGKRSRTYDSEGILTDQMPMRPPDMTPEEAQELLDTFRGVIKQKVPAYSAVRVNGQKMYELARRGIDVDTPVREVEIKDIKLIEYSKPFLRFRCDCSKGTYIRTLAHDIGIKLGCGAYLSRLRRVAVGPLTLNKALSLSEVGRYHANGTLHKHLLTYDKVLTYSAIKITDEFKKFVISGRELKPKDIVDIEGNFAAGEKVVLKDIGGNVLAVGRAEASAGEIKESRNGHKLFSYIRVLN
jgi:tRNA pseudouridine55 synthase